MKLRLKEAVDSMGDQLVARIEGTPFHVVKQENNMIIVVGKHICAQGIDVNDLENDFKDNVWNIIWFLGFLTSKEERKDNE